MSGSDLRQKLLIDAWIRLDEADESLLSFIDTLKPLGSGNRAPLWAVSSVNLAGPPRIVGKNHLKMMIVSGSTQIEAIAFGMADQPVPEGPIDMVFEFEENLFRGRRSLQLNVKDFRSSAA